MTPPTDEKRIRQRPGDRDYVNNKEFTLALDEYSRKHKEATDAGVLPPRMSNYLGDCIMRMANRLSGSPRFRSYPFRDEMVHNGILAAVKYAHKFNGDKFDNGFAYITQVIFSHMIITIKNEKRKYETNLMLIQQAEVDLFGNSEFTAVADRHAASIADQKRHDMQKASVEHQENKKRNNSFGLRTGYTKEERDAYTGGTPVDRSDK